MSDRVAQLQREMAARGVGVCVFGPSENLRYLLGYDAIARTEGDDTELAAGMVITVEPGVYLGGRYGIRIEDTVAITDEGPRRLTRGARALAARPV